MGFGWPAAGVGGWHHGEVVVVVRVRLTVAVGAQYCSSSRHESVDSKVPVMVSARVGFESGLG